MYVLGVSCDYHDAAAALVHDGSVVAAAEQERFSRRKHDARLPEDAVASCLAMAGIGPDDVDTVVFHEKPLAVVSRVLAARQRRGPAALPGFATEFPTLIRQNLLVSYRIEKLLRRLGATRTPRLAYSEHHLSHAAAAFLPSPFTSAAILTVDGIGEWATATLGQGVRHRIDLLQEQRFPQSVGLLYSLATVWCGFEANDGEYKLMGLAPYGEPTYAERLSSLVRVRDDGSLDLDARKVRWWGGSPARMRAVARIFDGPPRRPDEPITAREANIARTVQDLAETAVLRMAQHAHEVTGERDLCMAGGVALNCVANGRVRREGPFDRVWVQPAAGDAGSAVGAALWYWHGSLGNHREVPADGSDAMRGALLGPNFGDDEVQRWLDAQGIEHRTAPSESALVAEVADRLASGDVVGWFQGRMEFGPRALGNRSILADPRSESVQRDLNLRVKGRESFRPFAPAVLAERASEWFAIDGASPYMLSTFPVADDRRIETGPEPKEIAERVAVRRSDIPACTHVDGSARVQTVDGRTNPRFHALLGAFADRTGCPVLVNTSFNVAGEPIVCTPEDAVATAVAADLDLLVIGDHLMERSSLRARA